MALVKELKNNGVRVIGLDADPLSAGLYCCDKGYLIPRGRDEKFLDEILRICEKEKPNMILSSPEEELLVLSKNKSLFAKKGILVLCPDYDRYSLSLYVLNFFRAITFAFKSLRLSLTKNVG